MPNRRTSRWIACGAVMWLSVGSAGVLASGSHGALGSPRAGRGGPAGSGGSVTANATVAVGVRPPAAGSARPSVKEADSSSAEQAGRTATDPTVRARDQSAGSRLVRRPSGVAATHRPQVGPRSEGGRAWYADGLIALAIVLGMIAASALAVRKWFGKFRTAVGGGDENLQVVSRLALSPKQSVCLIRLSRQVVLLGVTPDQISLLTVVEDPEAVSELLASADRSPGPGLGDRFARFFSSASSSYDASLDETEPDAEMPMATGDRHYRRARTELSGLLDKVRSHGRPSREHATRRDDDTGLGTIAVA